MTLAGCTVVLTIVFNDDDLTVFPAYVLTLYVFNLFLWFLLYVDHS